MNNADFEMVKVTHGVPQGSVLGPKLFIMYINDTYTVLNKLQCIVFAGDTTLHASRHDLELLLDTIEIEVQRLKKWFDLTQLLINLKNTKYIILGNPKFNQHCHIKIGEVKIEKGIC